MDWDRPPWNCWAFQNVRQILPTAEVWRGAGPVRPLARGGRDIDGLAVASVHGGTTTLAGFLDETYTDGFLVIRNGAIVYERYFNGMGERTLHLSQSVAKSVTAAAAGALAGKGLLDTMAKVTDYLPELNDTAYRGASLQHVLDMTSGVHFDETYSDPYSDIGKSDVASGWKPIPPESDPSIRWPRHMFELILSLETLERRHGDLFAYRSVETDVLAFCMERAAGKRLPQIVAEEIWQPMGAEESASFTVDPAGYALADGGFNACLRDYGRLWPPLPRTWCGDHAGFLGGGDAQWQPRDLRLALQYLAARRRLQEPVVDRGPALARHLRARRVRPADLRQLGLQNGGGEAVELARLPQHPIQHPHPAGASRHRRTAWVNNGGGPAGRRIYCAAAARRISNSEALAMPRMTSEAAMAAAKP